MPRRIALVVNADSGAALAAGRRDVFDVFSLLMDASLGGCDSKSPPPVADCVSRAAFQEVWHTLLSAWDHQDQLLFYFSGHGVMRYGKYTLAFGAPPAPQQYLPFDNLVTDMQAHAVRRAVLILDACHSGAALKAGVKDAATEPPKLEQNLPDGIVVLASCRESEQSFELEGGTGSVFTSLVAEGIRSGLGGKATGDSLIGPDDLMDYINGRLLEAPYSHYPQRPTYQVSSADRTVWIARNKTPAAKSEPPGRAHTLDELRLLYDLTEGSRHPCLGSTLECLDWELIAQYAAAAGVPLQSGEAHESAARRLQLFSSLSESLLHKAAVLCFARAPHLLLQQARSIFIQGDRASRHVNRVDVLGPLSSQVERLSQLVMDDVYRRLNWRATDRPAQLLAETVREAVSNAITHRDYMHNELVRVAMRDDVIEITNPGAFPRGVSFESLIAAGNYSVPRDAAIAWYLTTLLAYEGVGRGFSVYSNYLSEVGRDAVRCEQSSLGSLKLTIRLPSRLGDAVSAELVAPPKAAPPSVLESTMMGVGRGGPLAPEKAAPAPAEVLRPGLGELLDDRYALGPLLGEGTSGAVYLGEDTRLSRQVAIKVMSKRFGSRELIERFRREAQSAGRIRHPGVVAIHDSGESLDRLFIVMEFVAGTSLETFLNRVTAARSLDRDLYFLQVAWLAHDIASALSAAHDVGIVHRDIKPSNVIVDETGLPRILDFGISRAADSSDSRLTMTGVVIGTPRYMSPEQIQNQPVDPRTDVYSLGVVMYELLCGYHPFDASTISALFYKIMMESPAAPRDLEPSVPPELDRICMKAMQRHPSERYESAQALEDELLSYLQTNPASANSADRRKLWTKVASVSVGTSKLS